MRLFLFVFILLFSFTLRSEDNVEAQPLTKEEINNYKINFKNVPLIEYIRFVSKICNTNFIFNEAELNFKVTVLSEDPTTPSNVMSTLIQVLRIYGLTLLEEDNNLVIHKNPNVKQIATIFSSNESIPDEVPIATTIFTLRNAKVSTLETIIRSMISKEAILETSPETQQIIVTDVTTNIKKIAELIEKMESPEVNLKTFAYKTKNQTPEYLIELTHKLLAPFISGSTFILIPHPDTNSIFITAPPKLIEKAIATLESVDVSSKTVKGVNPENVFIYQPKHLSADKINRALKNLTQSLIESGYSKDDPLIDTITNAKFLQETASFLFTGNKTTLPQIKDFLHRIDNQSTDDVSLKEHPTSFFLYKIKSGDGEHVFLSLQGMAEALQKAKVYDPSLIITIQNAKYIKETNTVLFTGTVESLKKAEQLISSLDTGGTSAKESQFFVYHPKTVEGEVLFSYLKEVLANLKASDNPNPFLIRSLESMKWTLNTNSLMFTGDETSLKEIEDILGKIDSTQGSTKLSSSFLIYSPKNISSSFLLQNIKDLANTLASSNLDNTAFLKTIQSGKIVSTTDSLLFTGDSVSLKQTEDLLKKLDLSSRSNTLLSSQFLIYSPKTMSPNQLFEQLQSTLKHFESTSLANPALIKTLKNIKILKEANSILVTGDEMSLKQVDEIVKKIEGGKDSSFDFLIYDVKSGSSKQIEHYLKNISDNLATGSSKENDLKEAISGMKWLKDSHSFLFCGKTEALKQIKELLKKIDATEIPESAYSIYRLQNVSGDIIGDDLDLFAKNLKEKNIGKEPLIEAIYNIKWIKETNSLLLTGGKEEIAELKKIIADYDTPRELSTRKHDHFFIYKPETATPEEFQISINSMADNLERANLTDVGLLSSLRSIKYVLSNRTFVFSTTEATLPKLKELVKAADVSASSAAIQHIGKNTFLLYKLKKATALQMKNALKALNVDLKRRPGFDREFTDALTSVKYIKESNSLLFTGTESALIKVKTLVESFDLVTPPESMEATAQAPGSYFVYKPLYLSGPALESILRDFAENLKGGGLANPELFHTIESMRWVENTSSLIFTGTAKSLDEIKNLLITFDSPTKGEAPAEVPIQAIENVSFLVYKLQFHKGDEIQTALKQIANNLKDSKSNVDQGLLSAINSTQWLQITNSLLCSGPPDTIGKLKSLIKSLDVPLKQVFIEILVIQTQLSNLLNFGLDWGSKYKYKNKLGVSTDNLPKGTSATSAGFPLGLNSVNATTYPNPNTHIPFQEGFDFGVIGDIIMHKGKSFLSLGTLIKALKVDSETTVVMTPKIIAQDGKTSSIFSGQNVPYIGSYTSNSSSNIVQSQNIEYKDIGLNLTITPVIGNNNTVTLAIDLNQSTEESTTSSSTDATSGVKGITTSKTTMNTTIHMPDKKFLILSGMVTQQKKRTKYGIPCLGGLPLIGMAFSESDASDARNNIVIFIRPHIINSYKDMGEITDNQEDYFREYTGAKDLETDYDESIDLLKTYSGGDEEDEDQEAE